MSSTDIHRHLQQMQVSVDEHSYQIGELHARSAHLERDVKIRGHSQSRRAASPQQVEVLRPLQQELQHRLQQAEELNATLSQTRRELRAAEERLQVRTHGSSISVPNQSFCSRWSRTRLMKMRTLLRFSNGSKTQNHKAH